MHYLLCVRTWWEMAKTVLLRELDSCEISLSRAEEIQFIFQHRRSYAEGQDSEYTVLINVDYGAESKFSQQTMPSVIRCDHC